MTDRAAEASAGTQPAPRPELAQIGHVVHGAVGTAELAARGVAPDAVIDFSASMNPLGPAPGVMEALRGLTAAQVARYPEPTAAPLRRAIAERHGLEPEQVIVGNGSSEVIWLLALAYARPAPERALIVGPTFGEYERACQLLGAAVERQIAGAVDSFAVDVAALARRIVVDHPRLVWLCNPNNPTGVYLGRAAIERLLHACGPSGALLVVDEAYVPFVDGAEELVGLIGSGRLFLLRSMTKDYALAGLRLGYGLGSQEVVQALRKAHVPWSVSAAAQAAGQAALADEAHLMRSRHEVWAARTLLVSGMRALEFAVVEPAANFVLAEVPGGWRTAAHLRGALFTHGCVVRDCASFGLPRHIRVGVRSKGECERLLTALGVVVAGGAP